MSSQGLELGGTVVGLDLEGVEAVANLLKGSIALDPAVGGAFSILLLLLLRFLRTSNALLSQRRLETFQL